MSTHRHHTPRARGLRITLVSLFAATVVIACGSDDNSSNTTGATTAVTDAPDVTDAPAVTDAPDVTDTTNTSPTVVDEDITQNNLHETCMYRALELIADKQDAAQISVLLNNTAVTDLGPITADGLLANELHLFSIELDPLDAAQTLFASGVNATPNYIFSFAPIWHYAPYDIPESRPSSEQPSELSTSAPRITVLDTGWAATTTDERSLGLSVDTKVSTDLPWPGSAANPPNPTEVLDGQAAGHGTFIVNLLGQLIPDAKFTVAGISPRYSPDDTFKLPDGTVVSVRDDATVSWALSQMVGPETQYLNLSFGSYGCTALHDTNNDNMEPYLAPLGVQTALVTLGELGSQAFAASGNDFLGPNGPYPDEQAVFYPAGWGPQYEWLHSVASDPKNPAGTTTATANTGPTGTAGTTSGTDTTAATTIDPRTASEDYSNRGVWVETQARGSKAVSLLPDTTSWGAEHWAAWSGTSFATPCALAKFIEDQENPNQGLYFESGAPVSGGLDPGGPYMECGVNVP